MLSSGKRLVAWASVLLVLVGSYAPGHRQASKLTESNSQIHALEPALLELAC